MNHFYIIAPYSIKDECILERSVLQATSHNMPGIEANSNPLLHAPVLYSKHIIIAWCVLYSALIFVWRVLVRLIAEILVSTILCDT